MGKIGATFILLSGVVICTTAGAQQPANRHRTNFVEASFSPGDVLRQSLAHAAVASTDIRSPDHALSRQDLLNLMILVSLPNKHPQ